LSKTVFTAIGVGQGDAFFLEKDDKTVLVDGGKSRNGFHTQFQKETHRNSTDILVCTHNDSDHANGVLGFLENGLPAKEVWLPASWMGRLEDLFLDPIAYIKELIQETFETEGRNLNLDQLGDSYKTMPLADSPIVETNAINIQNSIREKSEVIRDRYEFSDRFFIQILSSRSAVKKIKLIRQAVMASNIIKRIVFAAYTSGSFIRWLDFIGDRNLNPSGGIVDFLLPVNAIEVTRIRRPKRSALQHIALTIINKESLVFTSPEGNRGCDRVLFTADSDLKFRQAIPWRDKMIITSPHHGSEHNKHAYQRFRKETGNEMEVFWVRSDRKTVHRPGKSFLSVSGQKYCTLCRNSKLAKQSVRLSVNKNFTSWQPVASRKCHC